VLRRAGSTPVIPTILRKVVVVRKDRIEWRVQEVAKPRNKRGKTQYIDGAKEAIIEFVENKANWLHYVRNSKEDFRTTTGFWGHKNGLTDTEYQVKIFMEDFLVANVRASSAEVKLNRDKQSVTFYLHNYNDTLSLTTEKGWIFALFTNFAKVRNKMKNEGINVYRNHRIARLEMERAINESTSLDLLD